MTDAVLSPTDRPRRFRFDWIPGVFFFPRRTFDSIVKQSFGVWILPLLLMTVSTLILVLVAGPLKREALMMAPPELPPDFEYMSPEQQTQFMQAQQATQGPVFIYGFPALLSVGKVWLGWLIVGGLLHFVLTLLGGRGNTGASMNIVGWSALPFVLRDIVQIIAMLATHKLIAGQGIAGFVPEGEGFVVFLSQLLAMIDIYLIWNLILLVIGVRASTGLAGGKAITGAVITVLAVIIVAALAGYGTSLLGGLSVTRPFFF
jgi:hypothetical protein